MTLSSTVTLFPSGRAGGLLQAARPLEGEWQAGVYVGTDGCLAPIRVGPCDVGDADPQTGGEPTLFRPAFARQIVACSLLGDAERPAQLARQAASVTVEYVLGLELFDGAATTNPHLNSADTTLIGEDASMVEAIACVEAAAATGLSGRIAYIHVPQGLAAYLPDNLWRDPNGVLRTPAGNVVVISPGYSGQSIFGTGEVWAATSVVGTKQYPERSNNTAQAWADDLVLAVFDPCFLVEVATDIVACQVTSP